MLLTAHELRHRPLRARGWGGDFLAHAGSLAIRRRSELRLYDECPGK